MAQSLQCTLVTPEREVVDAEVTYASIPAWDGLQGVAPMRAPMLVKLGDGPLRLDFADGGSRWFFVGSGFAQVKDNRLSLLTSEAVPAGDIVRQDMQAALAEAQARVATTDEEVAKKTREVNRAKVMLTLHDQVKDGV